MTYPEAVAPTEAETLRSRTKLLVEVYDFIEAVLANLVRKLFIVLRIKYSIKMYVCFERFRTCMCPVIRAHAKLGLITSYCRVQ